MQRAHRRDAAAGFSACANTPITGAIMTMELFGSGIAPYVSIACAVSYLVVGYRGILELINPFSTEKSTKLEQTENHNVG